MNGAATTSANAAGWYQGEVVVDFSCSDPKLADGTDGSGVASCPTSKLVKGDGAGQSVTSDLPKDTAGNVGAAKTVGGINIDGTAPSTTSNNLCTATNGYCTGSTADVILTATDQAGLSGVKEIHYVIDGGAEQVAAGASKTVSVPLSGIGRRHGQVLGGRQRRQRRVGQQRGAQVGQHRSHGRPHPARRRRTPTSGTTPTSPSPSPRRTTTRAPAWQVSPARSRSPRRRPDRSSPGWRRTPPATPAPTRSRSSSTRPRRPSPVPSRAAPRTASGWYTGPVTVTFTCGDALSGVATCPDPRGPHRQRQPTPPPAR